MDLFRALVDYMVAVELGDDEDIYRANVGLREVQAQLKVLDCHTIYHIIDRRTQIGG